LRELFIFNNDRNFLFLDHNSRGCHQRRVQKMLSVLENKIYVLCATKNITAVVE
jgi:hypothetical protein